jgi:N-acetylmuramoyl-L-alanine amidase
MPSILVEVSFISNPLEEKRLKNDKYLDSIVNGVMDGLKKYIDSMKVVAYK